MTRAALQPWPLQASESLWGGLKRSLPIFRKTGSDVLKDEAVVGFISLLKTPQPKSMFDVFQSVVTPAFGRPQGSTFQLMCPGPLVGRERSASTMQEFGAQWLKNN